MPSAFQEALATSASGPHDSGPGRSAFDDWKRGVGRSIAGGANPWSATSPTGSEMQPAAERPAPRIAAWQDAPAGACAPSDEVRRVPSPAPTQAAREPNRHAAGSRWGPPTLPPDFVFDLAHQLGQMGFDDTRRAGVERTVRDIIDAIAEDRLDRAGGLASGLVRLFAPDKAREQLAAWRRAWLKWEIDEVDWLPARFYNASAPAVCWPVCFALTDRYGRECMVVLEKDGGATTIQESRGGVGRNVSDVLAELAPAGSAVLATSPAGSDARAGDQAAKAVSSDPATPAAERVGRLGGRADPARARDERAPLARGAATTADHGMPARSAPEGRASWASNPYRQARSALGRGRGRSGLAHIDAASTLPGCGPGYSSFPELTRQMADRFAGRVTALDGVPPSTSGIEATRPMAVTANGVPLTPAQPAPTSNPPPPPKAGRSRSTATSDVTPAATTTSPAWSPWSGRGPPPSPPAFPFDLTLQLGQMAPDDARSTGVRRTLHDVEDAVAEGRLDTAGCLISGLVRLLAAEEADETLRAWKRAWLRWEADQAEELPVGFENTQPPGVLWPLGLAFTDRYGCARTLGLDKEGGPATMHDHQGDPKPVLEVLRGPVGPAASRPPQASEAEQGDQPAAGDHTPPRAGPRSELDDDRGPGPCATPKAVAPAPSSAATGGTGGPAPARQEEAGPLATWVAIARALGVGKSTIRGHRVRTDDRTSPLFADAESARVWYRGVLRMPKYVAPPSPRSRRAPDRRAPDVLPPAIDWKMKV